MNPYSVDLSESNTLGPLVSLDVLYEGMPKTTGCSECASVNGEDNKDWCCKKQSPSMYYCEFLKVFEKFQKWGHKRKTQFILRAVSNYLDNGLTKGCIFYDDGCQVYTDRPLTCRVYGVVPKESWDKRWESLKERQGESFQAEPQCSLVTSKKEVTPEMDERWFEFTQTCETRLGVSQKIVNLHDLAGGSYRTFHDHLLVELFNEDVMNHLTQVRLTNPSRDQIDLTVETIKGQLDAKAIQN